MAKKIVFELDIDEQGAVQSLNKVEGAVDDVGKATTDAKKATNDLSVSFKTLLSGAGIITLIAKAVEVLTNAFSNNQKIVDLVRTGVVALEIVFADISSLITDTLIPALNKLFGDGKKGADDLGKEIDEKMSGAMRKFLEGVSLTAAALKLFFAGQMTSAVNIAKIAFDKLGQSVAEYVDQTKKAAEEIVKLEKTARLLELQQQRLREQYDRDAEQQRQIRDDVNRGFEERIEANRKLGEILNQQQEAEQRTVRQRIAILQNEQEKLGFNQEKYEQIYALQTELIAIEAQQAGFRSEQLTNEISLLNEKQAALDDFRTFEQKYAEEQAARDEKARADGRAAEEQFAKEQAERRKKEADEDKALQDSKIINASQVAAAIGSIAEDGSGLQKAAAVTQATIDTIKAALSAFANTPTGIVGKSLAAAAATAFGLASIKRILSTPTLKAGGGTPPTPGNLPTPTAPPPEFTTPDTGINQLGNTITSSLNARPVKAYVVSSDITTAQQFDRKTLENTTL